MTSGHLRMMNGSQSGMRFIVSMFFFIFYDRVFNLLVICLNMRLEVNDLRLKSNKKE